MVTVETLIKKLNLKVLAGKKENLNEIYGCYIGDLLSFVLAKGEKNDVWLTVVGNVNAVAVCTLLDFSCMILTDGSYLDEDAKIKADEKNVTVLSSDESSFELSLKIAKLLDI